MTAPQKNWFITGVSSGLGRALAAAVLDAGDRVAGTVRSDGAKREFEASAPGRAHGFVLDVRETAAIGETVRAAESRAASMCWSTMPATAWSGRWKK